MLPLIRTIRSGMRPRMLVLMLLCAALAVVTVAGIVALAMGLSVYFTNFDAKWLNMTTDALVGIGVAVIGWFMLPALTVLMAGMFQEIAIHWVEKRDYPDRVRKEGPRFWPDMLHDIKFTVLAILLNALILPTYLLGIGFPLSIALNTYLLGREFFESAAGHHLGKPEARALGKQNRVPVYVGGFVLTMITLCPFLNVFAPILSVIWMVHVYHGLTDKSTKA